MAIFNSYVKLPEGTWTHQQLSAATKKTLAQGNENDVVIFSAAGALEERSKR